MSNAITIIPFDACNENHSQFLLSVFNSGETVLFWSPEAAKYNSVEALLGMLDRQLGNQLIFIGCRDGFPEALYMAHGISKKNQRANVMVYIRPSCRRQFYSFTWWVLFLCKLQEEGISRLFAKIFCFNQESLRAAASSGFEQCGVLPEYILTSGGPRDVFLYTRAVKLNHLESYWHNKIC